MRSLILTCIVAAVLFGIAKTASYNSRGRSVPHQRPMVRHSPPNTYGKFVPRYHTTGGLASQRSGGYLFGGQGYGGQMSPGGYGGHMIHGGYGGYMNYGGYGGHMIPGGYGGYMNYGGYGGHMIHGGYGGYMSHGGYGRSIFGGHNTWIWIMAAVLLLLLLRDK